MGMSTPHLFAPAATAVAPAPTVGLVDDDPEIRDMVADYLGLHGFKVLTARDAVGFRRMVETETIDVAVLDVHMPGENGLSLARWLRETGDTGIVFATGADRPIDRIVGLEVGADDYLVKPYDLRELAARLRCVLRRINPAPPAPEPMVPRTTGRRLVFGDMTLDVESRRLTTADHRIVDLTAMEFDLLEVLVSRPNRVLSRGQLSELAHGRAPADDDRSIDIRITRLRKKIEPDPTRPRFIRTVRGEGYLFQGETR
ncbi:response regulator [Methyloraptor flagellatus]|uniref:Regulatory protein VirG n=1 Tax=Methyloraptor flagellatus TaxID=3162530 RepID=A0AAU7XD43_9HYPH